jgi:proteasome lid subunit RPN8/RPN11
MREDAPWIRGGLTFTRPAMDAVLADAQRGYAVGEEACGYLVGPADDGTRIDEAVPMENLAEKLHRLDPLTYFRTARTFFAFNEKRFDDAVRARRTAGRPVKVLYHSHLDTGAYFSATDRAVMSMGEPPSEEGGVGRLGAGPAWPLAFLVVSVRATVVDDVRLFVWDGSDFVESPFSVVP